MDKNTNTNKSAQELHSNVIHSHAGTGRKTMIPSQNRNDSNGCYHWIKNPRKS